MQAPEAPIAARVYRNETIESVHRAHAAVVDATGNLVAAYGDPDRVPFTRSSIKAFQLAPLVASGAADRFGFSEADLAVMCSSHSGEPMHVERVAGILDRIGLGVEALQCGADPPFDKKAAAALQEPPTAIHNNCSGKHAAMLAAAVELNSDPATYLDPEHPVQRRIRLLLSRATGVPEAQLRMGVDGCSAPNYAVPVRAGARLFSVLARPRGLGPAEEAALRRISAAMVRHPELVAGSDRFDTRLMRAGRGRLAGKIGGEAVFGVADLDSGSGLYLKIEDGNMRAVPPVTVRACRGLGWLDDRALAELARDAELPVHNVRGLVVGRIEAAAELAPVLARQA